MSSQIHTDHTSFGKLSEQADTLIIEISLHAIDLCELVNEHNKPLHTAHYTIDKSTNATLKEHFISAINHYQLSKKTYKFVYVNFFTELFTLCPTAFYDAENARTLLEFNSGQTYEAIVLTDDITADIKLIYAIDEHLKSTLDNLFPHHKIKHNLSVLSQLMMHAEDLKKQDVLLNIHSNYIELVIKQDHKLLLANQYSIKTQEDILYYVLFALEQYQLNPANVTLAVIGNINSTAPLLINLKKYIKYITLGIGNKTINWQGVEGMPQHFNYTLINRLFCE